MLWHLLTLSLLTGGPQVTSAASPPTPDVLSRIAGDWQIVDGNTGNVVEDCGHAQRFAVSQDRTHVLLTELDAANWSANYLVIRIEPDRMLMYIEKEDRLTEQGDPVLWWADFTGPNTFRWRRYDWKSHVATVAEWHRCETHTEHSK
jgi:hypothetical protein